MNPEVKVNIMRRILIVLFNFRCELILLKIGGIKRELQNINSNPESIDIVKNISPNVKLSIPKTHLSIFMLFCVRTFITF